jgi:hypothetical protein
VAQLSSALCANTSLTSLSLNSASGLDMPGIRALGEALRRDGGRLRSLDLSFCQLAPNRGPGGGQQARARRRTGAGAAQQEAGPQGDSDAAEEEAGALWSVLAQALAANTSLRQLNLSHCGLSGSGAATLAAALQQNKALVGLDLAGFSEASARKAFAPLLRREGAALEAIRATGENFALVNIMGGASTSAARRRTATRLLVEAAAPGVALLGKGKVEGKQEEGGDEEQALIKSLPLATQL